MKEDTKEAVLVFIIMLGIGMFFLLAICAVIGVPAFAIIKIIQEIKV